MAKSRPVWQQLGMWVAAAVFAVVLVPLSLGLPDGDSEKPPPVDSTSSVNDVPSPSPAPPSPAGPSDSTSDSTSESTSGSSSESSSEPSPGDDNSSAAEGSPLPGTARAMLDLLPIKGKAPRTGYDREGQFGPAWTDTDRNGCDTRNDILARDLDQIARDGSCRVLSGELIDPFSASVISFVRGETTSREVQIDHLVPLANAWQTGAQSLSAERRELLANDPLNLVAVSGSLNAQKGDGDAATWLPPNRAFRCEYVARQIGVKHHYDLWVTQAEHDQMLRVLDDCPSYPALTPEEHGDYRPGTIPPL